MRLIPAWAPNAHPLLVHFPIALLITSVALDVTAYALSGKGRLLLRHVSAVLCVIGALAALATYMTGRDASQTVLIPGMAQGLVKDHWEWAFWTLCWFGGLAAVQVVLFMTGRTIDGKTTSAALVLAGVVGLALLFKTGDLGGRLVYEQGVGVGVLPGAPR